MVSEAVVQNYIKRCQRVEKNLDVSLDLEFRKDRGASLLDQLTYTTEDWQKHRPLRCSINFRAGSDWYKGLASLKTAVINILNSVRFPPPRGTVDLLIRVVKKEMRSTDSAG